MSQSVLISACLAGFPCRHDGQTKFDPALLERLRGDELIPVCPEVAGGLGIPRVANWIDGGRVFDRDGKDVTREFEAGAQVALSAARAFGAKLAVLKQNSPSCGTRMVGTPAGRAPGMGITARLLASEGLDVRGEDMPW